jgi:hypothetical protein
VDLLLLEGEEMKTVIEMARESKVVPLLLVPHGEYFKFLEHFAELVRADEREACAKVCDEVNQEYGGEEVSASWIAAAIRARSKDEK